MEIYIKMNDDLGEREKWLVTDEVVVVFVFVVVVVVVVVAVVVVVVVVVEGLLELEWKSGRRSCVFQGLSVSGIALML